jgi:hypothetical protein
VYIEQLLTVCAYIDNRTGVFILEEKLVASQHIREGEYAALALSDEGFYWMNVPDARIEELIQALGDQDAQRHVMALRYIDPGSEASEIPENPAANGH